MMEAIAGALSGFLSYLPKKNWPLFKMAITIFLSMLILASCSLLILISRGESPYTSFYSALLATLLFSIVCTGIIILGHKVLMIKVYKKHQKEENK